MTAAAIRSKFGGECGLSYGRKTPPIETKAGKAYNISEKPFR